MRAASLMRSALAALAPFALMTGIAHAQPDLGKPGGPVKLVVGYQPYYTQVVVRRGDARQEVLREVPAEGLGGRVPDRPAGRDHRQQHARQQAEHRLHGRHAVDRVDDQDRDVADIRLVANLGLALRPVQHLPRPQRRAAVQASPKEATQVARRQDRRGAEGLLHRPLRVRRRSRREAYQPKEYLNQNIEVITSNFRAGKIDAAVIWEPTDVAAGAGGPRAARRLRRERAGERRRVPRDARRSDQGAARRREGVADRRSSTRSSSSPTRRTPPK